MSSSEHRGLNMSSVGEMGNLGVPSIFVTEADTHGEGMPSESEGVTGKRLGDTIGEVGGVNTRGSLRTESDIGTKADGAGDDNPGSTDERRPMNSAGASVVAGDTDSAETSDDDKFATSEVESAWNMAGGSGATVVPDSISRRSKGEYGGRARRAYGAAA